MSRANSVRTSSGIEIGCAYLPPAPMPSEDAETIQRALLRKDTPRSMGSAIGWGIVILLGSLLAVHFLARMS